MSWFEDDTSQLWTEYFQGAKDTEAKDICKRHYRELRRLVSERQCKVCKSDSSRCWDLGSSFQEEIKCDDWLCRQCHDCIVNPSAVLD